MITYEANKSVVFYTSFSQKDNAFERLFIILVKMDIGKQDLQWLIYIQLV